eukprot:gene29565-35684_t
MNSSRAGYMPPTTNDQQIVMLEFQQRLVLLHHASKCDFDDANSFRPCRVTPYCKEMKALWNHVNDCTEQDCSYTHCVSTRFLLSHYNKCVDNPSCQMCKPLKDSIMRSYQRAKSVVRVPSKSSAKADDGDELAVSKSSSSDDGNSEGTAEETSKILRSFLNRGQVKLTPRTASALDEMARQVTLPPPPPTPAPSTSQHVQCSYYFPPHVSFIAPLSSGDPILSLSPRDRSAVQYSSPMYDYQGAGSMNAPYPFANTVSLPAHPAHPPHPLFAAPSYPAPAAAPPANAAYHPHATQAHTPAIGAATATNSTYSMGEGMMLADDSDGGEEAMAAALALTPQPTPPSATPSSAAIGSAGGGGGCVASAAASRPVYGIVCAKCHEVIEGKYRYQCAVCVVDFCFDCYHSPEDGGEPHEHPTRAFLLRK